MNHAALVLAITQVFSKLEPTVAPEDFATAVEAVTKSPDRAALLVTIAAHESRGMDRIRAGNCKKWECDPYREFDPLTHTIVVKHHAWGLFQEQRNLHNRGVWGSPDLLTQVQSANALLSRSWGTCRAPGLSAESQIMATINGYAGKRCTAEWSGLLDRLDTWRQVRRNL